MFKNLKISSVTFCALMVFCFLTFIGNVAFTVQNEELQTDVSNYFDEKASLRAEFLSKISASNLAVQADNFEMVQLADKDLKVVSKKIQIKKHKVSGFDKFIKQLSTQLIVAGY